MNAHVENLMGLGVPGQVVELSDDGLVATVDFFGERRTVRLELVGGPVAPGDYVLNHVGYAIHRIADHDIAEALATYAQLLREASDDEEDFLLAAVGGPLTAAAIERRDD